MGWGGGRKREYFHIPESLGLSTAVNGYGHVDASATSERIQKWLYRYSVSIFR